MLETISCLRLFVTTGLMNDAFYGWIFALFARGELL